MKTFATVTGPNGKVKLTFGPNAIESYCALFNCEPTIDSILASLEKGHHLVAICEIVRAGIEQTLFETGVRVTVSDYDACEILETVTTQEEFDATKAFFSVLLNQDFDQWYVQQMLSQDTSSHEFVKAAFFGDLSNN